MQGTLSPDRQQLCLTYHQNNVLVLAVIDLTTDIFNLHIIKTFQTNTEENINNAHFSFEWTLDSKEIIYGFYKLNKTIRNSFDHELYVYNLLSKSTKTFGCSAYREMNADLANNYSIVSTDRKSYLINKINCKTIIEFDQKLKKGINLFPSLSAEKVIYITADKSVRLINLNFGIQSRKIFDASIEAKSINWISDSVFVFSFMDIERKVGLMDLETNEYARISDAASMGYYPLLSPDRRKLIYSNTFEYHINGTVLYSKVLCFRKVYDIYKNTHIYSQNTNFSSDSYEDSDANFWINNNFIGHFSKAKSETVILDLFGNSVFKFETTHAPLFISITGGVF